MLNHKEGLMQDQQFERIINILVDMKADIGGLKKGQDELKQGQDYLNEKVGRLETDMSDVKERLGNLEEDMSEVKTTVNALADALIETRKEVKRIQVQG
jgi:predicted nuclease with TOPRIM domain